MKSNLNKALFISVLGKISYGNTNLRLRHLLSIYLINPFLNHVNDKKKFRLIKTLF